MKKILIIGGITAAVAGIIYYLTKGGSSLLTTSSSGDPVQANPSNPYNMNYDCKNSWYCCKGYSDSVILSNAAYLAQLKALIAGGQKPGDALQKMYDQGGAWSPFTATDTQLKAYKYTLDQMIEGFDDNMIAAVKDGATKANLTYQQQASGSGIWLLTDKALKAAGITQGLSGVDFGKIDPPRLIRGIQ